MWSGENVDTMQESFHHGAESVSQFNSLIATVDQAPIPKMNGENFTFRNLEGAANIMVFASETYYKPWIWYHYTYKGEYFRVQITSVSLFGDEASDKEDDVEKLLDRCVPGAPIPSDYDASLEDLDSIVKGKLEIEGKNVPCILYDWAYPGWDYVDFLYDGYYVSVVGDLSTFDQDFWDGFSLE